ncbi:MAG: hypothetical protein MUC78_08590, partial [Bacteroidales bacterium]|nr:hypothetical protein [Bacteroidales bacterium]
MRWFARTILPVFIMVTGLLTSNPVAGQCDPGKISKTIRGFGSIVTSSISVISPNAALGMPDGIGAGFTATGRQLVIDLLDTILIGQTYTFTWRRNPSEVASVYLNWEESIDGVSFIPHSSSGTVSTSNRYINTSVTAENNTRFIRISSSTTADFQVDAISYFAGKCFSNICGPGFTGQLISGNATYITQANTSNPTYANNVPNGQGAEFSSNTDRIRFILPYTIPAGQNYYIIWRPSENNAQMRIRESEDGSSWAADKFSPVSVTSTIFLSHIETTNVPTRYIEIWGVNSQNFFLDAIVFNAISCEPPPPDLDVTGSLEYCGSPLLIAPELLISDPADQVISAAYVQIGAGFVSGQDVLNFTGNFGITANYYSAYGLLILQGDATTSQYQSVLRSVVYSNSSATPTNGNREITVSLERKNHNTGHYYRYISNPSIYWNTAWIESDRAHLFGMKGYLVTITSQNENDFLISQLTGSAWIGASDYTFPEGDWTWVTGPETGTMFWQGGSAILYENWDDGEPNNVGTGGEDYGHLLGNGQWNDLPVQGGSGEYAAQGYYIEFGDTPGDPILDIEGIVNVNVLTGVPIVPSINGSNTVCPNATGVIYSTSNVPGHNYSWVVTGGTISGGQGTNSITVSWGGTNPGTVRVTESLGGGQCSVTTPNFNVTIGDIINPTITGSITVSNLEGCSVGAAPAAVTTVAALEGLGLNISDNCTPDALLTVTNSDVIAGTCPIVITRTYRVTDAYSNFSTAVHTINIDDNTPPVITGSIAVSNIEGCNAGAAPAAVTTVAALEGLGLNISDACTVDGSIVVTSSDAIAGTCPMVITRTYTVTDACGNSSTAQQTITIDDTTAPAIGG